MFTMVFARTNCPRAAAAIDAHSPGGYRAMITTLGGGGATAKFRVTTPKGDV